MAKAQICKSYMYNNTFKGLPTFSDFKLIEEKLPPLNDNEYLAEALYVRVAPRFDSTTSLIQPNTVPKATQLAKIIESKNKKFAVGQYIIGEFGWRTHTIVSKDMQGDSYLAPKIEQLSLSLLLGYLGLPGIAGYFGFLKVCEPDDNNVVVISSAAGAIGSYVGQIAKIKRCKVIGITSTEEKCLWLVNKLGFDHYINYKTDNIKQKLQEYAPDGVDCYFDNVGGEISSSVIYHMKMKGRICVCGGTALYYNENTKADEVQSPIKVKVAKMEGIHADRWKKHWPDAIQQNLQWLQENKLKNNETVLNKFENIPQSYINTLSGKFNGNVVIKV
ncbi:hypothetical protein FQA39_LY10765 [Lamprigera yunnana]|nr:hypothetical protein FQA39_LY10765 [Lamprigera yunnana]